MGLIHLTRVFTTYVDDMSHRLCSCVRVFEESSSISSLDPPQIVSNTTLAHSHLQFPTGYELSVTLCFCRKLERDFHILTFLFWWRESTSTMQEGSKYVANSDHNSTRARSLCCACVTSCMNAACARLKYGRSLLESLVSYKAGRMRLPFARTKNSNAQQRNAH